MSKEDHWLKRRYKYIHIPKAILEQEKYASLSPEAKLLYGLMMDRACLSYTNGWRNECGEVYIHYTLENVARALGCRHEKAAKIMRELVNTGLIKVSRKARYSPYEIVVLPFDDETPISGTEATVSDTMNADFPQSESDYSQPESDFSEKENRFSENKTRESASNNTNMNNTYTSNTESNYEKTLHNAVDYQTLIAEYPACIIDAIIHHAANALSVMKNSRPVTSTMVERIDGGFIVELASRIETLGLSAETVAEYLNVWIMERIMT